MTDSWHWIVYHDDVSVADVDEGHVATAETPELARLIAALPALHAALEAARPYVAYAADDPAEPDNPAAEVLRRLDAALAKAGAA